MPDAVQPRAMSTLAESAAWNRFATRLEIAGARATASLTMCDVPPSAGPRVLTAIEERET